MKERMANQYGLQPAKVRRLVTGTFHSLFYKILYHSNSAKWNGEHLLKMEWRQEQYIKKHSMKKASMRKNSQLTKLCGRSVLEKHLCPK